MYPNNLNMTRTARRSMLQRAAAKYDEVHEVQSYQGTKIPVADPEYYPTPRGMQKSQEAAGRAAERIVSAKRWVRQ